MENILTTDRLTKTYGNYTALDNVSVHIPAGEIYGLVGQNGAGKTTLIRLIAGMQFPTTGSFSLFGVSSKTKEIASARKRIGGLVETPALQQSLSARENLKAQSILCGCPSSRSVDELLEFVGLSDTGKRKVKDMSLGMRQRLAIAVALVGSPDFLILDEPTNGLDPRGIVEIRELILRLNKERRVTVLISSHILSELSKLATSYGFIDHGRLVEEISAKELAERCRKKYVLTVSDVIKLPSVLDSQGLQYKIVDESKLEIYSEVTATQIFELAKSAGVRVIDWRCEEEDLEAYFINLIGGKAGGGKNA